MGYGKWIRDKGYGRRESSDGFDHSTCTSHTHSDICIRGWGDPLCLCGLSLWSLSVVSLSPSLSPSLSLCSSHLITLHHVLPDLGSKHFEDVADITKDGKVLTDRVAVLPQVAEPHRPVPEEEGGQKERKKERKKEMKKERT